MKIEVYKTRPVVVDVFHLSHDIVDGYESGTTPLPIGVTPSLDELTDMPNGQYECKGWIMNPGDYLILDRTTHKAIEILDAKEFSTKYEELYSQN